MFKKSYAAKKRNWLKNTSYLFGVLNSDVNDPGHMELHREVNYSQEGRGTQQIFIRGVSASKEQPVTLLYPILLTEKVPIL